MPKIKNNIDESARKLNANKPLDAFNLLKNTKTKNEEIEFLKAESLRQSGYFNKSLKHYYAALKLCKDNHFQSEILITLASCFRTLGETKKAEKYLKKSQKLVEQYCFDDLVLDIELEDALILRADGKFSNALSKFKMLEEIFIEEKNYSALSFISWAKGGTYRLQGVFNKGIKEFNTALKYAEKAKDKISYGYALFGLAGIVRIAGDIAASEKYYRKAGKHFASTQDLFAKAYSLCGLANALRQKGDYSAALKLYKKSEKMYSEIGDKPDLGFVKWGIATLYQKQGELKKSLVYFETAENLFKNFEEKRGLYLTMFSKAQVFFLMGNVSRAVKLYDKTLQLAKKNGLYTYLENFT